MRGSGPEFIPNLGDDGPGLLVRFFRLKIVRLGVLAVLLAQVPRFVKILKAVDNAGEVVEIVEQIGESANDQLHYTDLAEADLLELAELKELVETVVMPAELLHPQDATKVATLRSEKGDECTNVIAFKLMDIIARFGDDVGIVWGIRAILQSKDRHSVRITLPGGKIGTGVTSPCYCDTRHVDVNMHNAIVAFYNRLLKIVNESLAEGNVQRAIELLGAAIDVSRAGFSPMEITDTEVQKILTKLLEEKVGRVLIKEHCKGITMPPAEKRKRG